MQMLCATVVAMAATLGARGATLPSPSLPADDDVIHRGAGFVITYPEKDSKIHPASAAVPFQLEYRKNSLLRLETERLTQPINLREEAFAEIFLEVQLERLRERVDAPLEAQRIRDFSWGTGIELVYFLPARSGRKDRRDLVTEVTTTVGETLYRFTSWVPERDLGRVAAPFARVVESFRPEGFERTTRGEVETDPAQPPSRYSVAGSAVAVAGLREQLAAGTDVHAALAETLGWKGYVEEGVSEEELSELVRSAEAAMNEAPNDPGSLKARAWAAYHRDRMVEMEQALEAVLRIVPDDADTRLLQALWYGFHPERAVEMASKAIELDPSLVPAHYVKARAEDRAGNLAAARRSLEETVRLDPTFLEARLALADVLQRSGDVPGAVDAYRAAVATAPAEIETRFRLALSLRQAGRVDDAILEYENLLRLDDALAEVHYNLAVLVVQELQKPEVAARHFRRFLELDPTNARAERVRAWLDENGYR